MNFIKLRGFPVFLQWPCKLLGCDQWPSKAQLITFKKTKAQKKKKAKKPIPFDLEDQVFSTDLLRGYEKSFP